MQAAYDVALRTVTVKMTEKEAHILVWGDVGHHVNATRKDLRDALLAAEHNMRRDQNAVGR